MMKTFLSVAIFSVFLVNAQEKSNNGFNHWSMEVNVGQNKAIRPFSKGYFTSNPDKYFNINGLEHFDIGTRYMFSTSFGLKLDLAYDVIKNNNNVSLPFKNEQYRLGLQGVANLGRMMHFETFTNRFGLLAHAGVQVSVLNPKSGVNAGFSEQNGGVILGLTPQFRITNRIVATADFSVINNIRQHLNWDGTYAATDNNLTGLMYNTSLGLTLYLDKNDNHADWYLGSQNKKLVDQEARERLSNIEKSLKDTDKDGVPDYLDLQNDTAFGLEVDSKGRFIDANKNGVPDEKDKLANDSNKNQVAGKDVSIDYKNLLAYEYNILYYENNRIDPNADSKKKIVFIVEFLKKYPETKIHVIGYTDNIGSQKVNLKLAERRAKKIQTILESYGIDSSRISANGNGIDEKFNATPNNIEPIARRVSILIE